MKTQLKFYSLLVAFVVSKVGCLDNGLAQKPPMGWMTWERYRCQVDCENFPDSCINEELIRRQADRLATDGWAASGYQYIVIDDCWSDINRDPTTKRLMPDPKRFPSGMPSLSDYVHSLGLKFGIYLDFGEKTCAGYPGSENFLEEDAQTMADWNVDYVKMDGCYSDPIVQPDGYSLFGKLLNRTGRPIIFSCSYPAYCPWTEPGYPLNWTALQETCNLWRMLDDVQDSWTSVHGILKAYEANADVLAAYAGPGHWNDPDMLIVGNFGLSRDQARVQMGMWCLLAAPLLLSTDLTQIHEDDKKLLQNPWLLRINQDAMGQQAIYLGFFNGIKIWTRQLADFKYGTAIGFFNPSESSGGALRLVTKLRKLLPTNFIKEYTMFDAFTGVFIANITQDVPFDVHVNPSGIILLIVQPVV